MKSDPTLENVLALHRWRVKYNGDNVGYGVDQYKTVEMHNYPEAYAVWGSGYVNLYKRTNDDKYMEIARKCAAWLRNNKSPAYKEYSWGLPWEWEYWGAPKETSYVTTTSFVGDFLISLHKEYKHVEYLGMVKSILKWFEEENLGESSKNQTMFYYSPFPKLRFSIYNATAKVGGLFAKTYLITNDEHHRDIALGCANYLIKKQNPDGSWFYSERNKNIDNYHTAFVLESMSEIYKIMPTSNEIKTCLSNGFRFYLKNFYYMNGRGEELSISAQKKKKDQIPLFIRKILSLLYSRNDKTTLYSYGSGIRTLAKSSNIFREKNHGRRVALYTFRHLRCEDGVFNHKSNVSRTYIREEGHMFDGLCTLLVNE